MFVINEKSKFKDFFLYLKNNFGVTLHFISNNKLHMDSLLSTINYQKNIKKIISFSINEHTIISDLLLFFKDFKVEFRNKNGKKLLHYLSLKECKTDDKIVTNISSVKSLLESAVSILKKEVSYSDIDWINRILRDAAYQIRSEDDKIQITKTLIQIYENEDKFTINEVELIFIIFCKSKKDCLLISKLLSDHNNLNLIKSFSIIDQNIKNKILL